MGYKRIFLGFVGALALGSACIPVSVPTGRDGGALFIPGSGGSGGDGGAACAVNCGSKVGNRCENDQCLCGNGPGCGAGYECTQVFDSGQATYACRQVITGCATPCVNGCCVPATNQCVQQVTRCGATCSPCGANADTCADGKCGCGNGPACDPSQKCVGGQCMCDATSCTSGCCKDNVCILYANQDASQCGRSGEACQDVSAQANRCLDGYPKCGDENRCTSASQICSPKPGESDGVACQAGCTAATCANGCCADGVCYRPNDPDPTKRQNTDRCGTGGAACAAVAPEVGDACVNGQAQCGTQPGCQQPQNTCDAATKQCMPGQPCTYMSGGNTQIMYCPDQTVCCRQKDQGGNPVNAQCATSQPGPDWDCNDIL